MPEHCFANRRDFVNSVLGSAVAELERWGRPLRAQELTAPVGPAARVAAGVRTEKDLDRPGGRQYWARSRSTAPTPTSGSRLFGQAVMAGWPGGRARSRLTASTMSPSSRRRSVLRSQNRRFCRGKESLLCHRRPAHPPTEESFARTPLPAHHLGGVGAGVPILPARVARAATLRGDPPAGTRRAFGSAASVPDGRLQLSAPW